jgi:hypothetical protein
MGGGRGGGANICERLFATTAIQVSTKYIAFIVFYDLKIKTINIYVFLLSIIKIQ